MIKESCDIVDDSPETCDLNYKAEYYRLLEENKMLKDINMCLENENKCVREKIDKLRFGMRIVEAFIDKDILSYLYDT